MYGSHITRWRIYSLDMVVDLDSLELDSLDLDSLDLDSVDLDSLDLDSLDLYLVDLVEASLPILVASTSLVDTVPRWY